MQAAVDDAQRVLVDLTNYSSLATPGQNPTTDEEKMEVFAVYEDGILALVERMANAGGALGRAMAAGSVDDVITGADIALKLDSTLDFRSAVRNDLTLLKRMVNQLRVQLGARATDVQDRMQLMQMFLNRPTRNRGVFVGCLSETLSSASNERVLQALTQSFNRHMETRRRGVQAWNADAEAQRNFRAFVFLLALVADEGEAELQAKVSRAGINWRRVCGVIHEFDTIPVQPEIVMAPKYKLGEVVPELQRGQCVLL